MFKKFLKSVFKTWFLEQINKLLNLCICACVLNSPRVFRSRKTSMEASIKGT